MRGAKPPVPNTPSQLGAC